MASSVDRAVVEEILGGDPLLTPAEAAARLGVTVAELTTAARAGRIASVPSPGEHAHWGGARRYRTSVITALTEQGIPPA